MSRIIRPLTWVEAPRLSQQLGVQLSIASETFQYTGSFKFRAASHVASKVSQQLLITASSGNFGQALAYACQLWGKSCIVVMPDTSSPVKIEAVREYGGRVELIDIRKTSRNERVQELARAHPEAYLASPFDDPLVIEGNSSLGEELARSERRFDFIICPIGGGGLASGILHGLRTARRPVPVVGAEPLLANDAAQSFRNQRLTALEAEPRTIADGARTLSLGHHNWAVLRDGLAGIIEVPEEDIVRAVKLSFALANLKVEPTGALAMAALLSGPERFGGASVCCIASGGNVDPDLFREFLIR